MFTQRNFGSDIMRKAARCAVFPLRRLLRLQVQRARKRFEVPTNQLFSRISIETRTDCNLKCQFCPQSINPRPFRVMTDDLFKKIIDDLATLQFTGRIAPLTNNEPLLDDRIVGFIAYARKRCPLSFLDLITNGTLLTEELLQELFAAGLDHLTINDYRKDRRKHPFRPSPRLHRIVELAKKMFQRKIYLVPRSWFGRLSNRAGNIASERVTLPLHQFCALPFTGMWVQPDGKAILCCNDYSYEEDMGDVTSNSLSEIWFGEKYIRIRAHLYQGDRTGKICQKCDYPGLPLPGPQRRLTATKILSYLAT